ncbi:MAG: hypothetical protein AB7P17_08485 [Nitrospirales bacterium]|nr:hypothetical protein [Nitrospirales bacterium]
MAIPHRTPSSTPSAEFPTRKTDDFSALRRLLLAPEQVQLDRLRERLENFSLQPQEVSHVLPDAIRLRAQQDNRLLASMIPITQEAFALSIKQSPQLISDAIAPILGPAIRKAVSRAMRGMLQSLNQTLEYGMSWQGLQWRWEAWKTGRPFAEVVLLHTLRFRVEQVFLIHKRTGLLLNHVMAEGVTGQGEEVISGMLTAIQDFVRDSFHQSQDEGLESLRIGELTVWVEQGPSAILASVIRGAPPVKLRDVLQGTVETIHAQYSEALRNFQGDAGPFLETRLSLEDCLQAQFVKKPGGLPVAVWVLVVACIGLIGWWAYQASLQHQQWTSFLNRIGAEPGIVITSVQEESGQTVFFGLRDPLAADPTNVLQEMGYPADAATFRLEPFIALTPEMLYKRALKILQPPETVTVSIDGSQVVLVGQATHAWISEVAQRSLAIPGITSVNMERLTDTALKRFETLRQVLEGQSLNFLPGQANIPVEESSKLEEVKRTLRQLEAAARELRLEPSVRVLGYSSPDGPEIINTRLSEIRAKEVLKVLQSLSLRAISLVAVGRGVDPSARDVGASRLGISNPRRVSFEVAPAPAPSDGRRE